MAVAEQAPIAYVIVTLPGALPVTIPVDPTDAMEPLVPVHVPPSTLSDYGSVAPWQIAEVVGVFAVGALTTVTVLVAIHVPIE